MGKNDKPAWWLCYLIGALTIGLLGLDYRVLLSDSWHKIFACVIVLGCLGLIARWLRANRAALASEDWDQQAKVKQRTARPRDVPLSPVQANYLHVMDHYQQKPHA